MGIIAKLTTRLSERGIVQSSVAKIGIQPGDSQIHVHAKWVAVRTYRCVPPRPPMPQTRSRMLRHNAIEAWDKMLKTGWRRCRPPVR
jgi:hypothetical protein